MSQQGNGNRPSGDVVYTSLACCHTLTKTIKVEEPQKYFSEQPHLDLEFTTTNPEKHLSGELHYHLIAREKKEKRVYIAFKGTENTNDWITNFKIFPNFFDLGIGGVHAGFDSRAKEIPINTIVGLLNKGNEVVVTGYSLGGAVAQLVLFRILTHDRAWPETWLKKGLLQCITFGSPYVGDRSYLEPYMRYTDIIHNFVNSGDTVPRLLNICNRISCPLIPKYKPIGRFHIIDSAGEPPIAWNVEAPSFEITGEDFKQFAAYLVDLTQVRSNALRIKELVFDFLKFAKKQIDSVKYHLLYHEGLLVALGNPESIDPELAPNQSSTLEDISPQISHYEWDPSSYSFSVYGKHLHEKVSLDIDGFSKGTNGEPPNSALVVGKQVLPEVIKYQINRAADIGGKKFNIRSHIPYHDVGGVQYVVQGKVTLQPRYQPAEIRSRMLTLSQLLVGKIALHALRSFTSGKFENEDLLEIFDGIVTPAMQQASLECKANDIISVVAIARLHQNDSGFIEKLFKLPPTPAVLKLTNPTFWEQKAEDFKRRYVGAEKWDFRATDVIELIKNLSECYPNSYKYPEDTYPEGGYKYPEGGYTPRPLEVRQVMDKLAELGRKYHHSVHEKAPETINANELDGVERSAQYYLQCLQCKWLAISLYLYWQQLKLSVGKQSLVARAIYWVTDGRFKNPTYIIDYEYKKRVKEMALALHVDPADRELPDIEESVSQVHMPSPSCRAEWSEFVKVHKKFTFADVDKDENERHAYNTWKLIKVVSETRSTKDLRFLVAVMGPTKSGKGTLLHRALEAKAQFGSNLNTICPQMYDATETTKKWKEDLIFTAEERAPHFEAVDMPSIDDVTAREGKNQFQLTHQLCPFLDAVVILLKAPGLNDAGVNRILEMVKINSRCKVLLTIGHLERFWDDVTVMNTSKPFDPDDPDDETETVSGQAERAATTILALLEKLNVDSWKDRIEIVLTDVRYVSRKQCSSSVERSDKYDELVQKLEEKGHPLKFFFTIDVRKWLQCRYEEYCVEWRIATKRKEINKDHPSQPDATLHSMKKSCDGDGSTN